MFDITLSYRWLRWQRPTGPAPDPPKGIGRAFVNTPSGPLEILHVSSHTAEPSSLRPPLFFIHGGMGSAAVWTEYLGFFAERGIPAYAISLRGHGASWHPSFLRMVFGTTKAAMAEDAIAGIRWVEAREGKPVVLVGHSGGGGLSQYILTCQSVRVKGLALLAPIPGFGGSSVFQNWSRLDPWLVLRAILQAWHPNSPLSHPALTKRAFFGADITDSYVVAFQRRMCAYESYLWPWGMMRQFADPGTVVRQILGGGENKDRMLVMSGSEDKLMTVPIMKDLAERHRAVSSSVSLPSRTESNDGEGGKTGVDACATDSRGAGVRSSFVLGAGHHLQNDVPWQEGAQKLLEFYEQV